MATYRVNSAAAGANDGSSWTDAYTAFGSAVTAASADGDIILVHYTHQEEIAADTTYTLQNNVRVVSVDKDSSDAPTVMGTGGWIGNSTTNRTMSFSGADRRVYLDGITLRTSGATADSLSVGGSSGFSSVWSGCYFWHGNSATSSVINLANSVGATGRYLDCTFRFGDTSQKLICNGLVEIIGGSISASGSIPTALFDSSSSANTVAITGMDLSLITGTLVQDNDAGSKFVFDRCRLGSGVVPLASQTSNPTLGSASVLILDSNSGDTHISFGHFDALGSTVSDTSIYFTAGAAAQSWKIDTTSNVKPGVPYVSPWIAMHNTGLSSITPYLEILRDGSASAYTDAEVWAEFVAKTTSGYTIGTRYSDGAAALASGSSQASGAGLGSWTGESGTAWSGKIDSGSSFTPAEVGGITARVVVGVASSTVYVDPQIRT